MAESHVQRKLLDMMKRRIPTVIAIVLLLTVVPVMVYNLKQFNKRETL